MRNQEIATRYARAAFQLSKENKSDEKVLAELREVERALKSTPAISQFFSLPLVTLQERKRALEKLFQGQEFCQEVRGLLTKLLEKGRFGILPEVVHAFQNEVDASHGVVRGTVKSAAPLWPDERKALEEKISRYTGKKAVLDYQEDKSLLGGLVAEVGSLSFDDSLETQLRLIREELKRRAN